MYEEIRNSKNKLNILCFFIFDSKRAFPPAEVSKILRIPYLKTIRCLGYLVKRGPLRVFTKKGKKYFIANFRHHLPLHIRSLLLKHRKKQKTDKLFVEIKKVGNLKGVFLSGIFAGQPNLPVDILLVGKINLKKLANFLKYFEKIVGQEINYSIMTSKEFVARRDTFDKFIRDIFDYHHIVVVDKLKK